jgi:hypothetical protein
LALLRGQEEGRAPKEGTEPSCPSRRPDSESARGLHRYDDEAIWKGGLASGRCCRAHRSSWLSEPRPSESRPSAGILVAEWLRPAVWAKGGAGETPAKQWWAHVDSNHGPLPYRIGRPISRRPRHEDARTIGTKRKATSNLFVRLVRPRPAAGVPRCAGRVATPAITRQSPRCGSKPYFTVSFLAALALPALPATSVALTVQL